MIATCNRLSGEGGVERAGRRDVIVTIPQATPRCLPVDSSPSEIRNTDCLHLGLKLHTLHPDARGELGKVARAQVKMRGRERSLRVTQGRSQRRINMIMFSIRGVRELLASPVASHCQGARVVTGHLDQKIEGYEREERREKDTWG